MSAQGVAGHRDKDDLELMDDFRMASFGKRLLDDVAIDLLALMNTLGIFPSSDETPPASGVRSGAPHTPDLAVRIFTNTLHRLIHSENLYCKEAEWLHALTAL